MQSLEEIFSPFSPPESNIVERLLYWVEAQPDVIAYRYLVDGEDEEISWTYAELADKAKAIASQLVSMGMRSKRALLLYPPGIDFVAGFFGCHFAGVVPIPAYPPRRNRNMGRIQAISEDADALVALTVRDVVDRVSPMLDDSPSLKRIPWIATEEIPVELASDWVDPHVKDEDLALLQYTSGSTGSPKGVMLSHANIIHNCSLITRAFGFDRNGSGLSWLPTYHDMGLIGGVVNPLYYGRPNTLMSPMAFMTKPLRWLQAISKYKITVSGGPNFAYALCTEKINLDECGELDLSSWDLSFNGAEPIRADVLDGFTEKFGRFGFRPETHYPCYGMAESTLIVTGGRKQDLYVEKWFDGEALDQHRVEESSAENRSARRIVGCGQVLPDEKVLIVDAKTRRELAPGLVGEIWVQSPSIGSGYWDKPEVSAETFNAVLANDESKEEFLRTGDLGFLDNRELYVTGRVKDLIIVRGVNRYPQDIEVTVETSSDRLRTSGSAAFSIEKDGQERLVIVCEVERGRNKEWDDVISEIRRRVVLEHELPPESIVLVRAGSVPKTSSGKIQRHACRQDFLDEHLLVVASWSTWDDQASSSLEAEPLTSPPVSESTQELPSPETKSSADFDTIAEIVMVHVRSVAQERAKNLTIDTNIVVDLGLDSLERLQIASSLEETFGGRFPDEVLQEIETIREVSLAVAKHIGSRPLKLKESLKFDSSIEVETRKEIPESYYKIEKMPEYIRLEQMQSILDSTGIRNPYFSVHEGCIADTTKIDGRELISFSSYNYLGLSGLRRVSEGAIEAVENFGTSVSASRLVSGQKTIHVDLDRELASFIGCGDVVTFPGGHATNESVIGHLLGSGDLIIHDSLAHNSIVQGALLSGARRRPFPHNDWQALDEILGQIRHEYRRVMIAIEGLYSMDGDYPELDKFIEIKNKHKAILYVDEAHSIGTIGETGRGLAEFYGIDRSEGDLWMGTMSKSLASCGGFVGGNKDMIKFLRYTTPGYVFAAGIPPANVGAALASLKCLQDEPERVTQLGKNSRLFLDLAKQKGIDTGMTKGAHDIATRERHSAAAALLRDHARIPREHSTSRQAYDAQRPDVGEGHHGLR